MRSWRRAHERFFGRAGVTLTDETKLVCVRFKVVPLAGRVYVPIAVK